MSAEGAQEFGIIDAVMEKRPVAPESEAQAA
jgi:ATP-dependent protease ClpP protease subunit